MFIHAQPVFGLVEIQGRREGWNRRPERQTGNADTAYMCEQDLEVAAMWTGAVPRPDSNIPRLPTCVTVLGIWIYDVLCSVG